MATAGAIANTTVKNSRASRESGLLCSHSHGESIATQGAGGSPQGAGGSSHVSLDPPQVSVARPAVFQAQCPHCQAAVRFLLPPAAGAAPAYMGLQCTGCGRAFSVQTPAAG